MISGDELLLLPNVYKTFFKTSILKKVLLVLLFQTLAVFRILNKAELKYICSINIFNDIKLFKHII